MPSGVSEGSCYLFIRKCSPGD